MIQAVAMHENILHVSKPQPVSQPAGTRSQQSRPVSCRAAILQPRPMGTCARGHWDTDLPGSTWVLELMSHSGSRATEA